MALNFLRKGAASAQAAVQDAAERQKRADESGKLFRYWLKAGDEARTTFVDGELDENGLLIPPRYYEHNILLNGEWNNFFVCPERSDPEKKDTCSICLSGDKPSLVALFTVIDHRQYKSKKGVIYNNTRKLFVAKSQTQEILQKLAVKRGGLQGCTFDVSRGTDKDASVGSLFDFVEKKSVEELKPLFMREQLDPKTNTKVQTTYFLPADYEKEIIYRTGVEIAKIVGLGGSQTVANPGGSTTKAVDYSGQL